MASKINIAGELNSSTTEQVIANAKQVRLGDDNSSARVEDLGTYAENEEFIRAYTDAEGKFLWGIRVDGTIEWAKGIPTPIQNALKELENKIQSGLSVDIEQINTQIGSVKSELSNTIETNKQIVEEQINTLSSAIDVINASLKPLTDTFNFQENEEFVSVTTDAENRILEATRPDGKKYFPKQEMFEKYDDVEGRTEMTLDAENRILAYRDSEGVKHEEKLDVNQLSQNGKSINIDNLATKEDANFSNIQLSELDGVQDHSLQNLFDKNNIRTYDSDFADKVYAKIGKKTDETGCYSNNIECKEGDWFTRSDFGTGIVVVLDEDGNILGNVANAAYSSTIQIKPAKSEYDFSKAKYVVFVVMLESIDSERIVKAKYLPTGNGDYLTIPKLKVLSDNIDKDTVTYLKSISGRYYQLQIDDSGESPVLTPIALEGIPASELPSDFPTFAVSGDFSKYYDGLVFCPIEGGVSNYLYELATNGLVKRYIKQKVNCPRILKEGDTLYYYGVSGSLNTSSGKLNIYKAKGETFELIKGDLGNSQGEMIEPHDCLVLSVNPLHYICQRYVPNTTTIVNDEAKIVTALHVEEIYEGKSVWEWHSEDYQELWIDSFNSGDNADYLHNNTICLDKDGNLYLNNKYANQILVIERTWDDIQHTGTIGSIKYKIGGASKLSGYDVPNRIKPEAGQQWSQCHDAIIGNDDTITLFDNNGGNGTSRIIEFKTNIETMTLSNFKAYEWQKYKGGVMGSVDKCDENIYLVSWGGLRSGNAVNAGLYDFNSNKALFEIKFDNTGSSAYRVYGIPKV